MPTRSPAQVADYLTTTFWNETGRGARRWDISAGDTLTVNASALGAAEQNLVRLATMAWTTVSGIEFKLGNRSDANITFGSDSGAYAISQVDWFGKIANSEIQIGTDWSGAYGTRMDGYTMQTMVHELGHALGLGHAGNYNGSATIGRDNWFDNDSWQMSIMSYFSASENPHVNGSYAFAITPMPADIIAIHNLYGRPTGIATGATTYGWNSNAPGIHGEIARALASGDLRTPILMTIYDQGGFDTIDLSRDAADQTVWMGVNQISDVLGLRGNLVIAYETIIEQFFAGQGDDWVFGNIAANLIRGNLGADTLGGGDGNDTLIGNSGDDSLFGGSDADVMYGGQGLDTLRGGDGADLGFGNEHSDRIYGGNGNDTLAGDSGDDFLFGESDDDRLIGGAGQDALYGGDGNDVLIGGDGGDTLSGGAGDDLLIGEDGNNLLQGTGGRDTILGGQGNDSAFGGADADRIVGMGGDDYLDGGNGTNRLNGGDGNDTLLGGNDRDLIVGGTGNDRIEGGGGNDSLAGDDGNDLIYAGGGNDRVNGGHGNDQIWGQHGNNFLNGGRDNDVIVGGDGNDTIVGGAGGDRMHGQAGADVFIFSNAAESRVGYADVIADFESAADLINLSALHLSYRGYAEYSLGGGAELRLARVGDDTLVLADLNGDRRGDFQLRLTDVDDLTVDQFIL